MSQIEQGERGIARGGPDLISFALHVYRAVVDRSRSKFRCKLL